ncbi:MAG TPA: DUF2501 domain-containing protein [Rudaea sp.]|nr:DUF2501 domain-containing protein [Rudaea sp.]
MKTNVMLWVVIAAVGGVCATAGAQDMGSLKGLAGGLDPSSLASGTAGNAAGIIEYCMKNNFLGGGAGGVKDQLMGKISGGGEKDKADYADGANGLLKTGDGQSVDIGKLGSMKQSVTKKACASVLDHAKSLL